MIRHHALVGTRAALRACIVVGIIASCGGNDDAATPRYSADALSEGVPVEVDDPDGVIESATVFLPDELVGYPSRTPELANQGVSVMQPGESGYDAIIMYRVGGYCGLLPEVAAAAGEAAIAVGVNSRSGDDCDALEYDEAIGLRLSAGHEHDTVTVRINVP